MRAVVDQLACQGYGKCAQIAPDLFKLDDERIAHEQVEGDLNPEQLQKAASAILLCPVKAILWTEAGAREKKS